MKPENEVSRHVRTTQQKFQDGYTARDIAKLDAFMQLFAQDEGIEMIGIGASIKWMKLHPELNSKFWNGHTIRTDSTKLPSWRGSFLFNWNILKLRKSWIKPPTLKPRS